MTNPGACIQRGLMGVEGKTGRAVCMSKGESTHVQFRRRVLEGKGSLLSDVDCFPFLKDSKKHVRMFNAVFFF